MSEYYKDPHRYDDIINLPHHQSKTRSHMSLHDRAAQFAPFAALTGHEEALKETARLTDEKITLTEGEITKLNEQLIYLSTHLHDNISVAITYFKPDIRKTGGSYLTDMGCIVKINTDENYIVINSGVQISMEQIVKIEEK